MWSNAWQSNLRQQGFFWLSLRALVLAMCTGGHTARHGGDCTGGHTAHAGTCSGHVGEEAEKHERYNNNAQLSFSFYSVPSPRPWERAVHLQGGSSLPSLASLQTSSQICPEASPHNDTNFCQVAIMIRQLPYQVFREAPAPFQGAGEQSGAHGAMALRERLRLAAGSQKGSWDAEGSLEFCEPWTEAESPRSPPVSKA